MLRRGLTEGVSVSDDEISRAAGIIRSGGLVVFPTETVYGLGANALDEQAVARVYHIKGRPGDNPVILHVSTPEDADKLADHMPEYAKILAHQFWPGPLTLVLKKNPCFPAWVGGHPDYKASTIAVRVPSNTIARALIRASGCPIAAPSANKSGTPSPTLALHAILDLGEAVDMVLDGGAATVGLESTVVDVTGDKPVILRPGAITQEMIDAAVLGYFLPDTTTDGWETSEHQKAPRSPGMKYRHYAPAAVMLLVSGEALLVATYILEQLKANSSVRCAVLATSQTEPIYRKHVGAAVWVLTMGDRTDLTTIARSLYACLRECDRLGVEAIFAEGVSEEGLGKAIMNRMVKASGGRVVYV